MDNVNLSPPTSEPAPGKKTSNTSDREQRTFLLGVGLLLIVVLLWTAGNFITQGLYDGGYEKPFLVTYINTSAFAVYLLPFTYRVWRDRTRADVPPDRGNYEALPTDVSSLISTPYRSRSLPQLNNAPVQALPPLTTRETAELASIFCFFWFIANWAVNASLDFTSVASSTVLSAMSGFFTLLIGRLLSVEKFTLGKLGAVAASFLGVLLISIADSSNATTSNPTALLAGSVISTSSTSSAPEGHPSSSNPMLGDFLALLSAFFYALYVTLLKVKIRTESRIDMQLFFGFVGLFNIVTLWPIGVILHVTGVEKVEWPTGSGAWTALGVSMLITLSSDYIYLIAMLKTTPLLVTVGLSLTIPLAVLGDYFLLDISIRPESLIGVLLILGSFIAVGLEGRNDMDEDGRQQVPGAMFDAGESVEYDDFFDEVEGSPQRSRGRSLPRSRLSIDIGERPIGLQVAATSEGFRSSSVLRGGMEEQQPLDSQLLANPFADSTTNPPKPLDGTVAK